MAAAIVIGPDALGPVRIGQRCALTGNVIAKRDRSALRVGFGFETAVGVIGERRVIPRPSVAVTSLPALSYAEAWLLPSSSVIDATSPRGSYTNEVLNPAADVDSVTWPATSNVVVPVSPDGNVVAVRRFTAS